MKKLSFALAFMIFMCTFFTGCGKNDSTIAVIALGEKETVWADEKGEAKFTFTLTKPALVDIAPSEAGQDDYDCYFYVENENGEREIDETFIHSNEWISRKAFLPAGKHVVTVTGISSRATCLITEERAFDDVILEDKDDIKAPATVGFYNLNAGKRTVKVVPQNNEKNLCIEFNGINTYYDTEQGYDIKIIDKNGKVVVDEYAEWFVKYDLLKFGGECTVEINGDTSGIVEIKLEK